MENLKKASVEELEKKAEEIRKKLIETVSKNGGHLATNLGVVELTYACIKFLILQRTNYFLTWGIKHMYIRF